MHKVYKDKYHKKKNWIVILEILKSFCNQSMFFVWRRMFAKIDIRSLGKKHNQMMKNKHMKYKMFSNV